MICFSGDGWGRGRCPMFTMLHSNALVPSLTVTRADDLKNKLVTTHNENKRKSIMIYLKYNNFFQYE